jgi:hypothetical protein
MFNQVRWERTLLQASGSDVYVITDTSPLNTLLYMPPDLRETPEVQGLVKAALELEEVYDGVSFYCLPVPEEQGHDPNRIHDAKQSAAINAIIPEVMTAYAPELWGGVIRLDGDLEDRFQTARANVLPAVRR